MPRRSTVKEAPPQEDPLVGLRYEIAALGKRVESLEASRPGRKAKPLIALRVDGVCAVTPDIDSAECPDSSIFRYQQGCHGIACKQKQHNAYERRKQAKDIIEVEAPVAKPKRRTPAKQEPAPAPKPVARSKAPITKKAPPTKRAPRRITALAG